MESDCRYTVGSEYTPNLNAENQMNHKKAVENMADTLVCYKKAAGVLTVKDDCAITLLLIDLFHFCENRRLNLGDMLAVAIKEHLLEAFK